MSAPAPGNPAPARETWITDEGTRLSDVPPWDRFDIGNAFGVAFFLVGLVGLFATVIGWYLISIGPASCVSPCPVVELDANNSVLIVAGLVVSIGLFCLGALYILIAALLRPPTQEKSS